MPNWCSCGLKVTGPKPELEAFKSTLSRPNAHGEKTPFSFHQTVPMPPHCFQGNLGMGDEIKHPCNWRDFGIANWSTKWDASEARVEIKPKSVKINFETAWSPPEKWLENVSKAFPTLTFEMGYTEQGMQFYGEMVAEGGDVSESTQDFPEDSLDDEGELVGKELKAHVKKWNTGMGG